MRVFHLQKVTGIGGSERHLLSLLPALRERGIDSVMGVLRQGEYHPFVQELDELGIRTITIAAGGRFNPSLVREIARTIGEVAPDLVHTHLMHADLYGQLAARATRTTGVSSVHSAHRFYSEFPYRTVAQVAGRLASTTIAISYHVANYLAALRIGRRGNIRVIHYGIDADGWRLPAGERESARARQGLSASDIAIGMAARVVPFKGHDFLIEAFARAFDSEPNLRLLIAGDGPLRRSLEGFVGTLPCRDAIRFLGYVPDVRSFMNACDVVAVPSTPGDGEGFGLAAIEAMASARPVVASDTDSLPEIVLNDETGVLVPPQDVASLASALVRLAKDERLRSRLGEAGERRVVEAFTLESMVDKTASAYEEVARERS